VFQQGIKELIRKIFCFNPKTFTFEKTKNMDAQQNSSTKLNPVQLHLLELFSKKMGENELMEIKALLVQYYKSKVEQEVNAFWDKKGFNKDSWNKATRDLHLRSKPKPTK
jgi:hypothetical protein